MFHRKMAWMFLRGNGSYAIWTGTMILFVSGKGIDLCILGEIGIDVCQRKGVDLLKCVQGNGSL